MGWNSTGSLNRYLGRLDEQFAFEVERHLLLGVENGKAQGTETIRAETIDYCLHAVRVGPDRLRQKVAMHLNWANQEA
ncbi:hypothetical protein V5E97_20755 [Singulisphaera sp. Ch08]|uniref:Uncharacterized protein n=1 Tax=Singulisphaera sp. Ch08 TaxID=3120278 RepID=A0AAU7C5Y8_9BACT